MSVDLDLSPTAARTMAARMEACALNECAVFLRAVADRDERLAGEGAAAPAIAHQALIDREAHPERYYSPMCACGKPLTPTKWHGGYAVEFRCEAHPVTAFVGAG